MTHSKVTDKKKPRHARASSPAIKKEANGNTHANINDRSQAFNVLLQVFLDGRQLTGLLEQCDPTPSAFTKAMCYGFCRQFFRLECMADTLVEKRPKEPSLWILLLLGLYQLQFLNKPEYATVQETVALVTKINKPWAKGLVNAVLRRFCRERNSLMAGLEQNEVYRLNHPQWFIKRLQTDWPEQWEHILNNNDQHPPMNLRVNAHQTTVEAYEARLHEANIQSTRLAFAKSGLQLEAAVNVHELPGFAEGDVSVQDAAAQLAVSFMGLQPGMRVLDVCAAPGGKACHMLETEPNLELTTVDIDERRLQRVADNLKRLGLQAKLQLGDALDPSSWWDGQPFDRILLDAPCSATGVIRRHPEIRHLRSEAEVLASQLLQAKLLCSIWPLLKTGGMMVYATCSVLKAENELQIADFISKTPDCSVLTITSPPGAAEYGLQLFPGEHQGDGFFYSVLTRNEW